MVINMDESQLRTIDQIEQFLAASSEVAFTAHGDALERYAHFRPTTSVARSSRNMR
jgi:hypothetical protein